MHFRARLSKASQVLQVAARCPVIQQQLPGARLEHGLAIVDGCCLPECRHGSLSHLHANDHFRFLLCIKLREGSTHCDATL